MGQILHKNNSNVLRLINDIKEECQKNNVRLKLTKTKYVKISHKIKVGGYFYSGTKKEKPILACAMGSKFEKSISILIHESCHLDQWVKKIPLWERADSITIIDEWLNGKEYGKKELNRAFKCAIELELDCEKRSLEKIKKYKIPIDSKEYVQRANSYILFYNYVKKHRKWSTPGNPPYSNKIYKHAPSRWIKRYDKIPKKLEIAYDKYLNIV